MHPKPVRSRRTLARALAGALALLPIACKEGVSGFGSGARAHASADQFFAALADRHLEITRNAKYDYSRVALAHGALTPSRVFDDSVTWTSTSGPVRLLETYGARVEDKYYMASQKTLLAPSKPGDGRHVVTLSRLSDNEYQWETAVDFALGTIRPPDLTAVISRFFAAGEGLNEQTARARIAATMPKTAIALGSVFSLDTIRPTLLTDGSTSVQLAIGIQTDLLKQRMPAFAQYLHKYLDPARARLLVSDRSGAQYVDVVIRDRSIGVRVRTLGGHLVPLTGVAHPMPDTLSLQMDFTTKVKIFNVGFHELQLDFVNSARGDVERTWTVTGHKEPKWNLPLLTARLIRSPLRRPFEGEGALFRIGVRAEAGDQTTVLFRQGRLTVQESAILKFINSLSNTAMDDFGAHVEKEENEWLRELFLALREDSFRLLP